MTHSPLHKPMKKKGPLSGMASASNKIEQQTQPKHDKDVHDDTEHASEEESGSEPLVNLYPAIQSLPDMHDIHADRPSVDVPPDLDHHGMLTGTMSFDQFYKHNRPLSPTPVMSGVSGDAHLDPLNFRPSKSYSNMVTGTHGHGSHASGHGSHVVPPLHPIQNLSNKQFCDYIENMIIKHVNRRNSAINHEKPLNMQLIKKCVGRLKHLLLPEPDTVFVFSDDHDDDIDGYHNHSHHIHHSHHLHPHPHGHGHLAKTHSMNAISERYKQEAAAAVAATTRDMERRGEAHTNAKLKNGVHIPQHREAALTAALPNGSGKEGSQQQPLQKPLKGPYCTHSTRSLWTLFIPSSALLHHPTYCIDPKKYYGLLRASVRQDWNTIENDRDEERNWEELKPHWFELFFDLMFVAAIVHISSEVAEAYEHQEYWFIFTVFPQFGLLVLCWLEQVLFSSRFRMTQTWDGFLRFAYMALVLMMGLSIGNAHNQTNQKLFLLSYMLCKFIMVLMFAKSCLIPRALNHSVYMMVEDIISIVVVICIEARVNVPESRYEEQEWIWLVIYTVLFTVSWFYMVVLIYARPIRDLGINIPINVPHIAERMGAFVLIILGETIISIMVQHIDSKRSGIITAYAVTMSFFLIVYCIGKLYFESQPTEYELHHHRKVHALSASVWRARIYKWFHIVLFFGLLALGLGSKITVHELPNYRGDDAIYVFLPGIACVVSCVSVNVIRLTHPFDYRKKRPWLVVAVWFTRFACIAVMTGVLFAWDRCNHGIILGVYVACFLLQIFIDFEAKHRLIVTKNEEKDKSLGFYRSPQGALRATDSPGDGLALNNIDAMDGVHHDDEEEHKHDISHISHISHSNRKEMTHTREVSFIGTF